MKLSKLINGIPIVKSEYKKDIEIQGIAYDSRKIEKDFLFICIKGFETDGHKYIQSAIEKGAVAILLQDDVAMPENVVKIQVEDSRSILPLLADNFYAHPSQKLRLMGITGTNGKTTSTYLIDAIFRAHGEKTGLLGTIKYKIGDDVYPALHTTPESLEIQTFLSRMVAENVQTAVMEVSSHALDLGRVNTLDFDVAIFTNLTRDHLDYHKTFDAYRDAKLKLFQFLDDPQRQRAIINFDDPEADYFAQNCNVPIIGFAIDTQTHVYPIDYKLSIFGTKLTVATPKGTIKLNANLRGKSNIYNILTAIAVAISQDIDLETIKIGIESVENVAGRFESVDAGQDFGVVVDYAHTPDALERLLTTVNEIGVNRLICVFGCGGDRDRGKRPVMGEIAARLSDVPIVTSDNPRTEDPNLIIEDILEGITTKNHHVEPDRGKAIQYAIQIAQKDDVVVIAGKGHEDYQILGKTKIHFDDKEEAQKAIQERKI